MPSYLNYDQTTRTPASRSSDFVNHSYNYRLKSFRHRHSVLLPLYVKKNTCLLIKNPWERKSYYRRRSQSLRQISINSCKHEFLFAVGLHFMDVNDGLSNANRGWVRNFLYTHTFLFHIVNQAQLAIAHRIRERVA